MPYATSISKGDPLDLLYREIEQAGESYHEIATTDDKDAGRYAIAFAILKFAQVHVEHTLALDRLGMNNKVHDGPPGTTEKIAMELGELVSAIGSIS